jgi:LPS-assembly protein
VPGLFRRFSYFFAALFFGATGNACAVFLGLQLSTANPPEDEPVFLDGEVIEGRTDEETRVRGGASLVKGKKRLSADRLSYRQLNQDVEAFGNVVFVEPGLRASGTGLKLRLQNRVGAMDQPIYAISKTPGAHGQGRHIVFNGPDRYRLSEATFTNCPPGEEEWYLRARDLELDYERDLGVARGAELVFQDRVILYAPWMDFPLRSGRKTGFLLPTFGSTGSSGAEVGLPYYWNIAPNRDATFTPRYLGKRGLQLINEFRYLEPSFHGQLQAEVLPQDSLRRSSRSRLAFDHKHTIFRGLNASIELNRVSDTDYFTDLSSQLASTSQTNLPRDGRLRYRAAWWGADLRVQRFQTLLVEPLPQQVPYHRLPQLLGTVNRRDLGGFDVGLHSEYVDFSHPTRVVGRRLTVQPSVSYPMIAPGYYLTPKLGYHYRRYNLARNEATTPGVFSIDAPILSVDSGLKFEREISVRERAYVQTLEPRLFYVNIPFRNQSRVPNFDTALADFNFGQIFTENGFVGGDRLNDADQLTVALTTRFLARDDSHELLRASIGQRYYFTEQKVVLRHDDPIRKADSSDLLASASGELWPNWFVDTAVQHNPRLSLTERSKLGLRYQAGPGKVANLGYRYTRGDIEQLDFSGQWQLDDKWYGVGRWNYSLADRQALEVLAGFEYHACCWTTRFVLQRFVARSGGQTSAAFVQLELNGLSSIGANPLDVLKRTIPGYSRLNEE